jgi:uncharacterized protein YkwD
VNYDTNAALPGAVVYVSHTLVPGATAPMTAPSDGGETTTNASGSWTIALPPITTYPANFYIEVFGGNGMAVAHEIVTATAGGPNPVHTIGLTTLSTDEAGWVAQVNTDRAAWNAPAVVADETAEETARLWVAWVGQGYFEHNCVDGQTGCPSKTSYEASENADYTALAENIAGGQVNWQAAESHLHGRIRKLPTTRERHDLPVPREHRSLPQHRRFRNHLDRRRRGPHRPHGTRRQRPLPLLRRGIRVSEHLGQHHQPPPNPAGQRPIP